MGLVLVDVYRRRLRRPPNDLQHGNADRRIGALRQHYGYTDSGQRDYENQYS
jgi:hypothetical protein